MKKIGLALLCVLIIALVFSMALCSEDTSQDYIKATYLWDADQIDSMGDEYLDFARNNRVTDIYLQFDPDVDEEVYEDFIRAAYKIDIGVHLLAGAPDWVSSDGDENLVDLMDWLTAYQEGVSSKSRFAGINLDVEFYLYKTRSKYVRRYQELILTAGAYCEENSLILSTTVPFWYEKYDDELEDQYDNLSEWNISHSDKTVLMAYRNDINKSGGVVDIISDELAYANEEDRDLIVALETRASSEGDHVSFYGYTKSALNEAMEDLEASLAFDLSYKGLAIHYLDTWMEMEED